MDGTVTPGRDGKPVRINLALQGGGAHGAFTWGALDRLLQEPGIEIAGISGTSAGALNGAALKAGLVSGRHEAARENLDWLWSQIGAINDMRLQGWMTALYPGPGLVSRMIEYSWPYSVADALTRVFSPYDNAFYQNPLRRLVERFRYDQVCGAEGPSFFVSATNVRTGKIRAFEAARVGPDTMTEAILASTCLPTIFQAVEFVDPETGLKEAYWDGGYTGNPALWPLYDPALPDDIVIININPLRREDVPRTAQEIQNRINEISFNSSLLAELRAINFVRELIAEGRIEKGQMKDVRVHMISDDALMNDLSVATKVVPSPYILHQLKEAGRAAAEGFLASLQGGKGPWACADLPAIYG